MDSKKIVERLEIFFDVSGNTRLGEVLGENDTTISNWRNGRAKPKLELLFKKVVPRGVNLHWLLTGVGEIRTSGTREEILEAKYYEQIGRLEVEQLDLLAKVREGRLSREKAESMPEGKRKDPQSAIETEGLDDTVHPIGPKFTPEELAGFQAQIEARENSR